MPLDLPGLIPFTQGPGKLGCYWKMQFKWIGHNIVNVSFIIHHYYFRGHVFLFLVQYMKRFWIVIAEKSRNNSEIWIAYRVNFRIISMESAHNKISVKPAFQIRWRWKLTWHVKQNFTNWLVDWKHNMIWNWIINDLISSYITNKCEVTWFSPRAQWVA